MRCGAKLFLCLVLVAGGVDDVDDVGGSRRLLQCLEFVVRLNMEFVGHRIELFRYLSQQL